MPFSLEPAAVKLASEQPRGRARSPRSSARADEKYAAGGLAPDDMMLAGTRGVGVHLGALHGRR